MGFSFPYGYRMEAGEIMADPEKAPIVRQVFECYEKGLSYAKIANVFIGKGLDKHKVKRILENEKYTGNEDIPPLVGRELFQKVREIRMRKTSCQAPVPEVIQAIRKTIYCGACGGRYVRYTRKDRQWWRCANGCRASKTVDDTLLICSIHELLKKIKPMVTGTKAAHLQVSGTACPHEPILSCENLSDLAAAYEEIKERAVSAYALCPDEFINRKIKEIMRYQSQDDNIRCDLKLLHLAVDRVLITTKAQVYLHLYTGHVVE